MCIYKKNCNGYFLVPVPTELLGRFTQTDSGPMEPLGRFTRTGSGPMEPLGRFTRTGSGSMEPLGRFTRTGSGSGSGPQSLGPDREVFFRRFHGFGNFFSGGFTILRFKPVRNLSRTVPVPGQFQAVRHRFGSR